MDTISNTQCSQQLPAQVVGAQVVVDQVTGAQVVDQEAGAQVVDHC